jgi:serine/threonine protein kinase
MKYSPIMDNRSLLQQRGLNMEGWTQLVAHKRNCVKLAWAFVNIVNVIHHFKILHNDLSKDNILLHFPLDKLDVVYIVVYNWGKIGRLQEVTLSYMGLPRSKMPSTQGKCAGGWPHNRLLFIMNWKLNIPFNQWPNNIK